MRTLAFLPVLALTFAVGCGGDDNTDDTGTPVNCAETPEHPDCFVPPTYTYSVDAGTSSWLRKVDSATVCDYAYTLSGTEYKSDDCADCDYSFTVAGTRTDSNGDQGPKCEDAFPFTWPIFPTDNYGDVPSGFGLVTDGEISWSPYGYYDATDVFFAFAGLEYGGINYMVLMQPLTGYLTGAYYSADIEEGTITVGSGEGATGDTTVKNEASFDSGRSDTTIFCDGIDSVTEANAWESDPEAETVAKVATPTATGTDAIACSGDDNAEVDIWEVTVAAGDTLEVSIDTVTDGHFDSLMWINAVDADECTVSQSDDQFDCAQGSCGEGDNTFMCCPSATVKNEGSAVATYRIHVGSYTTSCESSDSQVDGLYTIDMKGLVETGTQTVKVDGYLPTIDNTFNVAVTTSRVED